MKTNDPEIAAHLQPIDLFEWNLAYAYLLLFYRPHPVIGKLTSIGENQGSHGSLMLLIVSGLTFI